MELTNVTVSGNAAGGAVRDSQGTLTLKNTVLANNPGGNCAGGITASSYSLDSGVTCGLAGTGDQSNADPKLGPLANNGGIHPDLKPCSPAIDTADPAAPPGGCSYVDQRSSPRADIANVGTPGMQCDRKGHSSSSPKRGRIGSASPPVARSPRAALLRRVPRVRRRPR